MPSILLTGEGYTERQIDALQTVGYDVVRHPTVDRDTLLTIIPEIDTYILGGEERLDARTLESARRLRLISFVGTGYGTFVDERAAAACGIQIKSTPGIMASAVAEHTIGLLLGTTRGLFAQNEASKRVGVCQATKELRELVVGMVGMGAIGTVVASILTKAFGCNLQYTNRSRKPSLEKSLGLTFVGIDKVFSESDVVVLLVALSPDTAGMVDIRLLSMAKPGLFLINTAAADLVEPHNLRNAIHAGRIGAAAFDGYWIEPLPEPKDDPYGLLSLPDHKFVVTPHTAAKTGTWARMVEWAVRNVIDFSGSEGQTK